MSRLIEALRKAEEAKRKEQTEQKVDASASEQVDESDGIALSPLNTDQNTENHTPPPVATQDDHSIDFELEANEAVKHQPEYKSSSASHKSAGTIANKEMAFELDPVETNLDAQKTEESTLLDTEEVIKRGSAGIEVNREVETENNRIEPSPRKNESYNRRQSDTFQLEGITPNESTTKKNKKIIWLMFIALILVILLVAAYYFLFMDNRQSKYSTTISNTQNRGFLGSSENTEITASGIEEAPKLILQPLSEEAENSILDTAQNLVGKTLGTLSESAVEKISTVSTLIDQSEQKEPEAQIHQRQNVLEIKRVEKIEGTTSSLSYARDNFRGGEKSAARLEYEELLRNQPTNLRALTELAHLELDAGNKPAARRLYSKLLSINPKDPVAKLGLLESSGDQDQVKLEAELKTLASIYPGQAFISFKLGNFLASQKRWSEARQFYEKALVAAKEQSLAVTADYAFNLAVALDQTQQHQLALKTYKEAEKLSHLSNFSFSSDVLNSRIHALEGRR